MSENTRVQSAVLQAGGILLLVDLLCNGDEDEQAAAGTSIVSLVTNHDATCELLALGNDKLLVERIRSSSIQIYQTMSIVLVLGMVTTNDACRSAFAVAGVFDVLVPLLRNGSKPLQSAAATAMTHLVANHETNKTMVVEAGIIELLASKVREGLVKAEATEALAVLAVDNVNYTRRIVQAGGLQALIALLHDGNDREQCAATWTLAHIACNHKAHATGMVLLDVVPSLVNFVRVSAGALEPTKAALFALSILSKQRQNYTTLMKLDILRVLQTVEHTQEPDIDP